jgi:hypothetical protein
MSTEPVAQKILHMFARPPRRRVFEQETDERFNGDDAQETLLVPKSLVDQAAKSLQALTFVGVEPRPRVSDHGIRITECQKRLPWYVAPPLTVTRVD